jgi:hypothetical protein
MPQAIDNVFGIPTIVIHVSHFIAGLVFEFTGYTTFGEYRFRRSIIEVNGLCLDGNIF